MIRHTRGERKTTAGSCVVLLLAKKNANSLARTQVVISRRSTVASRARGLGRIRACARTRPFVTARTHARIETAREREREKELAWQQQSNSRREKRRLKGHRSPVGMRYCCSGFSLPLGIITFITRARYVRRAACFIFLTLRRRRRRLPFFPAPREGERTNDTSSRSSSFCI